MDLAPKKETPLSEYLQMGLEKKLEDLDTIRSVSLHFETLFCLKTLFSIKVFMHILLLQAQTKFGFLPTFTRNSRNEYWL